MLDRHWSEKLEKLLEQWESLYRQGFDQCAQQLCRDGTSEFLQLLQERIDQQREENIEEARDQWLDDFEQGEDRTARDLRPNWPATQLKVLDERIAVCRTAQRKVQPMFGDEDEVEDFKVGGTVPGNPDCTFVKLLGAGGFGQAWLAHNKRMHKDIVFKFCSPRALTSLKNETELLARIDKLSNDERFKDAFVQMLATHIGEAGEPPHYVTYEFIPEGNLRQYMKGRCLKPFEASEVILALADKVALIHGLPDPIVHRDLKPENILVVRSAPFPPTLKIGDFGIGGVSFSAATADREAAKDYAENVSGCTREYASWEQESNPRRRVASDDVHALGVIWYELLTGERKSRNDTGAKERLLAMGMTSAQIEVLRKCFDGEKDRWPNAKEMAEKIRDRKTFPLLEQEVQDDIKRIGERRKKGEYCRQYIREVKAARIGIWNQAARQDLPEAQWLCGMCWELGLGDAKKDKYVQAAYWFAKAAEHGNAEAQYCLAVYHRYGLGGRKKDEDESHLWLEKAAAGGQIDALYELGSHWWQTVEELDRLVPGNEEVVGKLQAKLYEEVVCLCGAARQGHLEAQMSYSLRNLFACGSEWNMFLARERIMQRRLQRKSLRAPSEEERRLGGQSPFASDEHCLAWIKAAAERKHAEANFLLGRCCEEGIKELLEPDRDRAIECYRVAAEAGHLEAQFHLAECLREMIWGTIGDEKDEMDVLVARTNFIWPTVSQLIGRKPLGSLRITWPDRMIAFRGAGFDLEILGGVQGGIRGGVSGQSR